MPATVGVHHVAMITADIDRFVDFYRGVFDAPVTHDLTEDGLRHVFVDIGGGAHLHAFQLAGSPHAAGRPEVFGRGHLDHLALLVADEPTFERLRNALVERGASDGTVTDFGAARVVNFTDPDGFEGEIAMAVDAPLRTFEDRVQERFVPLVTAAAGTAGPGR